MPRRGCHALPRCESQSNGAFHPPEMMGREEIPRKISEPARIVVQAPRLSGKWSELHSHIVQLAVSLDKLRLCQAWSPPNASKKAHGKCL